MTAPLQSVRALAARPDVSDQRPARTSGGRSRGDAVLALARRVAVTVVGAALGTVGVVLLVLPGPGLLLVLAGLVLLATEYPWARRCTEPVRRRATAAARAGVASRLRIAWTAAVGLALVGAGVVWIAVPSLPLGGIATGSGLIVSGVVLVGLLIHSVRAFGVEDR